MRETARKKGIKDNQRERREKKEKRMRGDKETEKEK